MCDLWLTSPSNIKIYYIKIELCCKSDTGIHKFEKFNVTFNYTIFYYSIILMDWGINLML